MMPLKGYYRRHSSVMLARFLGRGQRTIQALDFTASVVMAFIARASSAATVLTRSSMAAFLLLRDDEKRADPQYLSHFGAVE